MYSRQLVQAFHEPGDVVREVLYPAFDILHEICFLYSRRGRGDTIEHRHGLVGFVGQIANFITYTCFVSVIVLFPELKSGPYPAYP